jgi:hypothetical protein
VSNSSHSVRRCLLLYHSNAWDKISKCVPLEISSHPHWTKFVSAVKKHIKDNDSRNVWYDIINNICFSHLTEMRSNPSFLHMAKLLQTTNIHNMNEHQIPWAIGYNVSNYDGSCVEWRKHNEYIRHQMLQHPFQILQNNFSARNIRNYFDEYYGGSSSSNEYDDMEGDEVIDNNQMHKSISNTHVRQLQIS